MVALVLLAIMLGLGASLYLKGTLAQGLIFILNAILAGFIALGFSEALSALLIKYAEALTAWAQTICFLLLFVVAFGGLQFTAMQLNKQKIDLGLWPERIGRPICGVILGYLVAGQLLIAAAMAPLPGNYPYARFNERNPNPSQPNKALLNPDGLVAGFFGAVSSGSLSAMGEPKSFALLHAGFLDELFLNRIRGAKDVPLRTRTSAIEVPRPSVREAPASLRDSEGNPPPARPGENLLLVTLGIKKNALQDAGKFTLSQVRLICRAKDADGEPLAGKGHTVYPVGMLGPDGRLTMRPLSEVITIEARGERGSAQNVELAFYVPTQMTPRLIGFKRNNLHTVSMGRPGEDASSSTGTPADASETPREAAGDTDSI